MARTATNVVKNNELAVAKAARSKVQKQMEWKVEGAPGLSLVVKPSGTATYYVRYHVYKGPLVQHRREAIGRHGLISFQEAKGKAHAVMTGVERGGDPIKEAQDRSQALTLSELFEERVSKDTRRARRTMDDYRLVLEADVFPQLGDLPAAEISTDQIADVLERIEARSKHAAHKARSALGSTFRWGLQRRKVRINPVAGLGFTHQSKPRNRILSDEELKRLWDAMESPDFGATEPMRLILKLAFLTGQRNSEVAGARKSELRLDGANPMWRIPAERMKRKTRDQFVPLSKSAAKLFARALELSSSSEYLFPGTTHGRREGHGWRAEHIGQESVSRAMAKARELAKVDGIVLHDLRKCVTTWLRETKHTPGDVCDAILHHARGGVTATHYDFATLEGPVRKALQQWAEHVESANRGPRTANLIKLSGS